MARLIRLAALCAIAWPLAVNAREPAPVYACLIAHWDWPDRVTPEQLGLLRALSSNHPQMKWTHLFNPVAYTRTTPFLDDIENYLVEARDTNGAEIGVHTHMFPSLVQAAGVAFRDRPNIVGTPPSCGTDSTGYTVPVSAYGAQEIRAIMDLTVDLFQAHGWGRPRSYCAGFYTTNSTLQSVIAQLGFQTSGAAFPSGTTFGVEYGGCFDTLAGWGDMIAHTTRPYRVSSSCILPDCPPPYLVGGDGPLVELPQVCKIDWMVSAGDMIQIFLLHHGIAAAGEPTVVCLVLHPSIIASNFAKFDTALDFIDNRTANPVDGVPVIYTTMSQARKGWLSASGLPCPPDLDGDGLVDVGDFFAFVLAFAAGDPAADLNGDGSIDVGDFFAFIVAFAAGCP